MMKQLALVEIDEKFFGTRFHKLSELGGIGQLVSLTLNIVFVAAGIILLIFFIMAGISLISGAGENNPEKLEKGKQAVTSALIGFIVVFAAYWIVKLIGNILGFSNLV